jgi:hypothetical protein
MNNLGEKMLCLVAELHARLARRSAQREGGRGLGYGG